MEKRTLLAFVLCLLVLIGWSVLYPTGQKTPPTSKDQKIEREKPQQAEKTSPALERQGTAEPPSPRKQATKKAVSETVEESKTRVETNLYKAVFTNNGPTIESMKLKQYREDTNPNSPLVQLVNLPAGEKGFLEVDFVPSSFPPDQSRIFEVEKKGLGLHPGSDPQRLIFRHTGPNGLTTTKTFVFHPDRYTIDLEVMVVNHSENPVKGRFRAAIRCLPPKESKGFYSYSGLVSLINDEVEEVEIEEPSEEKNLQGKIQWIGYEDNYFISAVVPYSPVEGSFSATMAPSKVLEGTLFSSSLYLGPQQRISKSFSLYLGPRDTRILKNQEKELARAVNFGWVNIIARPLLYAMRFFNKYTHNYGLSIILLTFLVKIIFWPLSHKSYKSMKEMQKIQPLMLKIKEKYKNDKEKLNKELMNLYKTYKVNPMGGCLPLIIQIPVFFALYRILGSAIELRHAPFVLWINDLSAPERLFSFPFDIPLMAPPYGIPVLTILMGLTMYLQQKMTPTAGDPRQAKMMKLFPLFLTFIFINFPSGLVLYFLVNNVLSIAQQYRIHKSPA